MRLGQKPTDSLEQKQPSAMGTRGSPTMKCQCKCVSFNNWFLVGQKFYHWRVFIWVKIL